jgi:O-antigen/teichoic acid export membrane protein
MASTVSRGDDTRLSPGLGYAGLSFVVNAVVVLASAVVTSRLYGIEVIGRYALAMTPWQILVSLSTLGEQVALVRNLATMRPGSGEATGLFYAVLTFSTALTTTMALPVLGITWLVLGGPIDQPDVFLPAVAIVVGYVVLENPSWNIDSVLSSFSQGRALLVVRLVTVLAFLGFAVLFHRWSGSVWGLAWANVASFGCGLVARLVVVRGLVGPWPGRATYRAGLRRLPAIVRFGAALLPGQLFIGLSQQAPTWIIAGHASIRQVGAYSRASTMAVRLNEASYRINEMLLPDLTRLHGNGDRNRITGTVERSLRLVLVALLLVGAVAGGAAVPFLSVFGDGFAEAAGALALLVLVQVCFVVCSMLGAVYNAMGRPGYNSVFASIRAVVGLTLVLVLAERSGITAAAAGLLVGHVVELAVRLLWVDRALGLRPERLLSTATLVRLALVYGVAFVATRTVADALGDGLASLVVSVVAGTVVFGVAVVLTGLLDADDRAGLGSRLGRLRGPAPA